MRNSCPGKRSYSNHRAYVKRKKRRVYEYIEKRTIRKEVRLLQADKDNNNNSPLLKLTGAQIRTLVIRDWKSRCAASGSTQDLVLCRWNRDEPLSLHNHVCLTSKLAQRHNYITNLMLHYGPHVIDRVCGLLLKYEQHDDNGSNDTSSS